MDNQDYNRGMSLSGSVADVDADRPKEPDFEAPQMQFRRVLPVGSIVGSAVDNHNGQQLGKIQEIMIDVPTGNIAYAVLSFGGFLGIGDKLFAVPWHALVLDERVRRFVLDIDKHELEKAPGFKKDNWPDMADSRFHELVSGYWGTRVRK